MNWKNRKLFNTLPQGIVSGLEPIPRYQMGGMVQGYETGGPFPNKGLAALNKVAPDVVKTIMGKEEGGFVNPRNYLGGGTVQYPIGMEAGTLVPEVFESGDQQINDALNTMISTTMPTSDAVPSMAIEEPTGDVAEIIPETTTGDSSSKESLFIAELNEQKKVLQDTIEKVVAEKTQEGLDPITLESQITDFITKADSLFKRKVTEIANKLNVEVMPEQITLLTDDFSTKLETMFPSIAALDSDEDMQVAMTGDNSSIAMMEEGGLVETAIKKQEELVKRLEAELNNQITRGDRGKLGGGTSYIEQARKRLEKAQERLEEFKKEGATGASIKSTVFTKTPAVKVDEEKIKEKEETPPPSDTSLNSNQTSPDLSDLLRQNARNIEAAALMTGKSKQGGVSGFMDVLGQANLLGAKAERENLQLDAKTEADREIQRQKQFLQIATDLDSQDEAIKAYVRAGMPLPKVLGITLPTGKVAGLTFSQYLDKNPNKTFAENLANFSAVAA